jgi:hypothetical protein
MRTLDWNSYRAHLRIPDCWTCFSFEGQIHELHDGRWRVRPVRVEHKKPGRKRRETARADAQAERMSRDWQRRKGER